MTMMMMIMNYYVYKDVTQRVPIRRLIRHPSLVAGFQMAVVVRVRMAVVAHTVVVAQVRTSRVLHIRTVSCRRCMGNNTNTANTEASIHVNLHRVVVHTVAVRHYHTEMI